MKRIITAFLALALAFGLYWFFEVKKKGEEKAKKEALESVFPGLKADDVVSLSLGLNDTVTLEKQGNEFVITVPEKSYSDSMAIDAMVKRLAGLKSVLRLDSFTASDLGLDKPSAALSIKGKNGNEYRLLLGSLNPAGTHVYAQVQGSSAAIMTSKETLADAQKKFEDLRFKGLLRSKEDEITKVRSTIAGKEFLAEKKGGVWVLASRGNAPIKWDRLKTAISAVKNASAKKFLKLGEDYGFKKDSGYLYLETGGRTEMLFFGRHDKKNYSVYARNGHFNYAVEAPDYVFTGIPSADDIINKQPLEFAPADVYGFRADMKDKYLKAEKDRSGKWKVTGYKGIKEAKNADIAALVSAIYGIESSARHSADEGAGKGFFGAGMNNLKITLYKEKGKEIGSITFAEKPTGGIIYVRNDATMDIYEVERSAVSGMNMPGMEVPK